MLQKVAKEKGYTDTLFFVDDGITGTTMKRPGFQKMVTAIEAGYISAVFVKDLSRLGRNYIEVGRLTEEFFPAHDVRLIAVSDGVDSDEGDNEFTPFRNIMNEWYAKDISKKRKIVNKMKGTAGIPLSQPPYGYIKNPDDPRFWVIDPEAADVVRRIYDMALEGYGLAEIANVVCSMMEKTDLYKWADTELTQKAQLAYEGQGDFSCGEWCRFCKAKAECRERAAANLALARYEFQSPALLDDEEIADILGKIDALTAWASDVKEYALQQAVSGKEWAGWKLVEGRSNRKYTSEAAVAAAVESAGFDPYERKVLGVTAMQKLLGKTRFEELLAPYIEKPQGKPTLVPESDKRPAMNTAKNDFMEEF